LLYVAQSWGYRRYDEVEEVQRYYIKRTYRLPGNTPNYMISLETKIPDLFLTTLKYHFDFILKLLTGKNKLSKQIALFVISKKILWYKEWYELAAAADFQLALDLNHLSSWKKMLYELLE
ncbi:hypothetical protein, partial [Streptomyces sp. IBSBF 2390]|uniref:hypothetical protein n=1 Tax=Streptomyces sp. IBSBF 2390 TaxID=2903533 RepID=UPI002FDBFDBB